MHSELSGFCLFAMGQSRAPGCPGAFRDNAPVNAATGQRQRHQNLFTRIFAMSVIANSDQANGFP